jgi:hypothetical protein
VLADQRDEGDADRGRDRGEEEQRAQPVVEELVEREAEQRADDGARRVGRAMQPERAAGSPASSRPR